MHLVAILLATTPMILAVMAHLHINPIWYGVLLLINLKLARIVGIIVVSPEVDMWLPGTMPNLE